MDVAGIVKLGEKLKGVKRRGWLIRGVDEGECESVSEHSYSVGLIAAIIAHKKGLAPEKAALMALIHDLPEALTGDITPHNGIENKEELEERAAQDIMGNTFFYDLWREWKEGKSDVAKVVREADNLERFIQAMNYSEKYDVFDFVEEGKKTKWSDAAREILGKL